MTFMLKGIMTSLWDDEDKDGSGTKKRFQNAFMYQLDRQRREMIQFIWLKDGYELMKSPISSARMVKEMAEALFHTVQTPYIVGKETVFPSGEDLKLNKNIYDFCENILENKKEQKTFINKQDLRSYLLNNGVNKGDRVFLLSNNRIEWVAFV